MEDKYIARLNQNSDDTVKYLLAINDLGQGDFITPGLDRDLTIPGQKIVTSAFPPGLSVERIVTLVQAVQMQTNPRIQISELDVFVLEASNAIYTLTSEIDRVAIMEAQKAIRISDIGTYVLAGIHILRKATKETLIQINPEECPKDQCYLRYLTN